MSDETEKPEGKKLRGFADPKNRKNINRGGRREGSRQSGPKDGEIEELFAKGTLESVHVLFKLLRSKDSTDSTKYKVASKFIDTHLTIEKQGGKLRVEQEDELGNVDEYEVDEDLPKEGSSGKVLSLIKTSYTPK